MDKSHQTPNDDRCEINCINLFCVTFGAEHTVQVINDDCVAVVTAPFKQKSIDFNVAFLSSGVTMFYFPETTGHD